jgi:hypothetical protein
MKFTASRLSEGNKIFPSEIHIEGNGVTVKIPGLFGGDSKFFDFHHIASVDVKAPMVGYSTVTFYAGGTQISAHGFTSSEVKQMKQAIEEGKGKSSGASDGGGSGTTIVNKSDGFLTSGVKAVGGMYTQMFDEGAKRDEHERQEKIRLQGKVEDLAQLQFGTDKEDISNKLNYLSGLGAAKPDKSVKSVIIDKMEFGIMKLRGLGAHDEASFFEKKLEPLKKKGWF